MAALRAQSHDVTRHVIAGGPDARGQDHGGQFVVGHTRLLPERPSVLCVLRNRDVIDGRQGAEHQSREAGAVIERMSIA